MGRLSRRGSEIVRGLTEFMDVLASGGPVTDHFKVTTYSKGNPVDPELFRDVKRCHCSFRQRGGHEPECHAYRNPAPVEDRGTRHWLWYDAEGENGDVAFHPIPGAAGVAGVSVPVGWSYAPDRTQGVVLVNIFRERATASDVWKYARAGERGFKLATFGASE